MSILKKIENLYWDEPQQFAFDALKHALSQTPIHVTLKNL